MKTLGLQSNGGSLRFVDLAQEVGPRLGHLPYVLRLLCENHLRHGGEIEGYLRHLEGGSNTGFEFVLRPDRLLMHDTTATPALTDIAAMRDVLRARGDDPRTLSPCLPCHVSVDHSVAVDAFARPDALRINGLNEIRRNEERYAFLKWASNAFENLTVFPPGTGIMHTINLEQLSEVMLPDEGGIWHPEFMLGTDSHTPMVNGIGVLAWGIGGLEAEAIMVGQPVTLAVPEVVGVRLTGKLAAATLATDLALTVTHRLRALGIVGCFVEFFGPGVLTLRAEERAVVANMAPEYGATTGYFPVDAETIDYLRRVGRHGRHLDHIEAMFRAQQLWFEPQAVQKYDRTVDIDLATVTPTLAGPRRPQDKVATTQAAGAVEKAIGRRLVPPDSEVPDGAVGVAAITSCTNTSDPEVLILAGLLARAARKRGLRPKTWVKTSLAPGSPASKPLLERAGLLDDLSAIGFDIVGFGCTTCIGNSGRLAEAIHNALAADKAIVAVLSGNRNFPGRVHPNLNLGFLASPPLVIAYALMGTIAGDPLTDPLGKDADGTPVFLDDLWPSPQEVTHTLAQAWSAAAVGETFRQARQSTAWEAIAAPSTPTFPWSKNSRILAAPPFVERDTWEWQREYTANPLLILGDDITTDHISPAGRIDPASSAGRWLIERGAAPHDLNVYASYRGNWEVMQRGLFANDAVVNFLDETLPSGMTRVAGRDHPVSLIEAARHYRSTGVPSIILAGERYGSGSSRDWAAKGVALLGVRAVIAKSFERIHRTNLIAMGITPIIVDADVEPSSLGMSADTKVQLSCSEMSPDGSQPFSIRLSGPSLLGKTLNGKIDVSTKTEAQHLLSGGAFAQMLQNREFEPGWKSHQ